MSHNKHGFDYKLPLHPEVPKKFQEAARRVTLANQEMLSAKMKSRTLQLKQLGTEYRQELGAILGTKELKTLRSSKAKDNYLEDTNSDTNIGEINQLKAKYVKKASLLHDNLHTQPALDPPTVALPLPNPGSNNNWDFYTPPYDGYFWSFEWDRSDKPDDPILARYIDSNNGQIGSSINTRLKGADDSDFLNAQYATGFNIWHQVRADGPLEAYIVLRVNDIAYTQKADDEFGWSDFTQSQFTRVELRILGTDENFEISNKVIYNHFEHDDGVAINHEWLFPRNDIHSFYFKSDKIYAAGSWVLLNAVIDNYSWFKANDYSIKTTNNVHLLMDQLSIRST
jgi:hypothetical protein